MILRDRLRALTEADIIAAVEDSDVSDALHGIAPVVLLELVQRVVDKFGAGRGGSRLGPTLRGNTPCSG